MNASRPLLNTDGRIHIREGRHPLLDPKKVVPITVSLGVRFFSSDHYRTKYRRKDGIFKNRGLLP